MSIPKILSRLLTPRETAALTGLSVSTLAKRRCLRSDGPRFVRIGRRIAYDPQDIADFVSRHKHNTTTEYVGASKQPNR